VVQRQADGSTSLDYLRGGDVSIRNKSQLSGDGELVFFHSHPSEPSVDGALGPLVSGDDLTGTFFQDNGGGYLNIVCSEGVTVCVDAKPLDEAGTKGWHIESGVMRGARVDGTGDVETMNRLRAIGEPYAYSITSNMAGKKLTFIHIPWSQLKTGTSLEGVCFGEGLRYLLPDSLAEFKGSEDTLRATLIKAKTRSRE